MKKTPGDIITLHTSTKNHDHMLSNSLKNQNFKKMKKTPGDVTIVHICTKNYDQMMYGS